MSAEAGHRVQMRWRDLDGLGRQPHGRAHLPRGGRDAFLRRHGIRRDEYVVGRCNVSFLGEIDPGLEMVTVECAVRDLGRSSVATTERILDPAGEVLTEAQFDLVLWDPAPSVARDRSPTRSGLPSSAPEKGRDELEQRPRRRHRGGNGRRRLSRERRQPEHPLHHRGDRRLEHRGERGGGERAHLHVREDDGTPSGRPELFVDVIDRIRAGTDMLTMVSTGGANDMTIDERVTGLQAKPEISRVESGSMNFGDETFICLRRRRRGSSSACSMPGIALEVEAFDLGHVVGAVRWLDEDPPVADADQPRLWRAAASTRRPRRSSRCCAPCRRRRSGPSPASAATTSG